LLFEQDIVKLVFVAGRYIYRPGMA